MQREVSQQRGTRSFQSTWGASSTILCRGANTMPNRPRKGCAEKNPVVASTPTLSLHVWSWCLHFRHISFYFHLLILKGPKHIRNWILFAFLYSYLVFTPPQFHLGQWQAQIGPGQNFRVLGKNNPVGLAEPQPPWQMGSQRLWIVWRRCAVYKIGREIDCDCMELSFAGTI